MLNIHINREGRALSTEWGDAAGAGPILRESLLRFSWPSNQSFRGGTSLEACLITYGSGAVASGSAVFCGRGNKPHILQIGKFLPHPYPNNEIRLHTLSTCFWSPNPALLRSWPYQKYHQEQESMHVCKPFATYSILPRTWPLVNTG